MVHYRRMVAAALHKLEEDARESGAPIDLGTGEGGGGGGERGDGVDDHVDDGSFHGSTAQQVGAMVLKLHAGDPQLDREDWYQRVRAALRGLTKDGEVDMLNLNRFRLAVEEEGDGVTWKLNVRFNDEDLMQVEVEVRANPDSDTPRLDPRREDARVATQRPIPPFSFAPSERFFSTSLPASRYSPSPPAVIHPSQPTCTCAQIRELVRTKFGARMSAERVRLRFNGAEVGNITVEEYQATRLAEAGVTDGSTLDLMIEPVDRDPEPDPEPEQDPEPEPDREPDPEPEPEPEPEEPAAAPVEKDTRLIHVHPSLDPTGSYIYQQENDTRPTHCACRICGEMREKADFSATVWKRRELERICKRCVGKELTCRLCSKPRDWCYYTGLSHQIKRECDVCTQSGQCASRFCSGCNQMKLKMDFSNKQAQKKTEVRMCQVCKGHEKLDKSIGLKLREGDVIVIEYSKRGDKIGDMQCSNCGEFKPNDQFSKSQQKRSASARRCLECLKTCLKDVPHSTDSTSKPPKSTFNPPESDTDEQLNRHEVVEKEAVGDGGWNEGGDGWVNLVKESGDEREDDVEDDVEDDGFDDYYEEENEERNGDSRRASVNASLGLPDDQDAEFLDASDYERDSLSGDSHENCELYGTLHSQVSSFASTAGPDDSDLQDRLVVQKKVSEAITALYPEARLEVFGSGATGLALKCADIDLVVLGVGPEPSAGGGGFSRNDREDLVRMLRKIEKSLRREKIVWKANVISTAKVPIIKMNAGRYAVDLTVGASNGLSAVQWIKDRVNDFVAMRPLILVLKKLLKTHHLDDASTGGCGGYLLVSLVVSHLRQSGEPGRSANPNLGALLLGFLRRFGNEFDYSRMAVAAGRPSGVIRAKDLVVGPGAFGMRPMILAEDPQVSVARAVSFSTLFFLLLRGFVRWTTVRRAR